MRHGVGQFHPRVAFFNGLDANPATVGPLLDRGHRIVVVHHQRTRHQMVLRGFPWLELASLRDATIR